jgi:hypothetical protein
MSCFQPIKLQRKDDNSGWLRFELDGLSSHRCRSNTSSNSNKNKQAVTSTSSITASAILLDKMSILEHKVDELKLQLIALKAVLNENTSICHLIRNIFLYTKSCPNLLPSKTHLSGLCGMLRKKLSNGLSDKNHNVSFKSCMLRIPNSINTKYEGAKGKVIVLQRWDGRRARPTKKFMLTDFHAYLVQEVIDKKIQELRMNKRHKSENKATSPTSSYKPWIERLLQTPVSDNRKTARDLILVPYLIVDKGLTDRNQIYDIVMAWADKCHELQRLKPSCSEYSARVKNRIDAVLDSTDKVPPMTLERTKQECPDLYRQLMK